MSIQVACVVEGHGEVDAVPIVIQRIAEELDPSPTLIFRHPIRTPKSKLLKQGELERAVELAARQVLGTGAVFVLLDSDDDCPRQAGPELLARAENTINGRLPISVVLAKREFEAWFIASAESVAGRCGLPAHLQAPGNPEDIRGAKEWLTQQMTGGRAYSPTVDQPALAKLFDLSRARHADSFEKFHRDVHRILSDPLIVRPRS